MSTETHPATHAFREAWDQFKADVEIELTTQERRRNKQSEKRLRKLLRSFPRDIYAPYRDGSLREPGE